MDPFPADPFTGDFSQLEPVQVFDPEILRQIYRLRVDAWIPNGIERENFPHDEFRDDEDDEPGFQHWAVMNQGMVLAAGRVSIHPSIDDAPAGDLFRYLEFPQIPPFAKINRLVVHPKARRHGLARKLDHVRLGIARDAGARTVLATWARPTGEARYKMLEAQGFIRCSDYDIWHEFPIGMLTALYMPLP